MCKLCMDCNYIKINENGKRLKCRKRAVTSDGFCALHDNFSEELGVTEELKLGVSAYDVLVDKDELDEQKHTTQNQRIEVLSPLVF